MKSIPFKCKFGHITIAKFQDNESKPSSITCETCKTLGNVNIRVFATNAKHRSEYVWIEHNKEQKEEKAMRY